MHIAINGYFWNRPNTGSGQYTRQLAAHLTRLNSDLKITLVVPQTADQEEPDGLPEDVTVRPVKTRPGHLGKVHFEQILFPQACGAVNADIAHVPYWGAPLRSPAPLVTTIHDLTTLLVRDYRRGLGVRLYNALVTASARSAGHIITDSEASKRDIQGQLGIGDSGVSVIYLAAAAHFKAESDLLLDMAIAQKYSLPEEYVLYLGGYEIHKNVLSLLQAYTYVHKALGADYPLVLAGKKPEKQSHRFPDYDHHIEQLELAEVVHWTGYIDEEDKPALYRGAAAFVFLSKHEGFGLPPLEAMACGIPVVASNQSSLPEVLGEAGFALDPDDHRGVGGSIIATIVQPELAGEMRAKGLAQAAKFSWKKTAVETLGIYERVAGSR